MTPVTAPTVTVTTTTTALSSSESSSVVGQLVTFTAVIAAQAARSPSPTGSVSFVNGSTVMASVALNGGAAQFTTTSLALGSHSVRAIFGGNTVDTGSESAAVGLSVQPDDATIIVTPSANPSPPNSAMTLTAAVGAAAPGSGTPTGTVTFYNGKKKIGFATLDNGMATLATKKLTLGTHTITVIYGGDADFNGISSSGLREVIKKAAKSKKTTAMGRRPVLVNLRVGIEPCVSSENIASPMRLRDLGTGIRCR